MIPPYFLNRPFIPLVTDRLMLRPLTLEDAEPMAALANDIRVAEMLTRLPHPYTLKDALEFIPHVQEKFNQGTYLTLAITSRSDGELMGVMGLEETFGYWLGHSFWGQGYGKEAAQVFINFCFTYLRQQELTAFARHDNVASCRVLESVGFQKTRTTELASIAYSGKKSVYAYKLTRKDFGNTFLSPPRSFMWASGAALVREDGQFLIAQRLPHKGLAGVWELPGGKLEEGESAEECLVREIKEELGITVREEDLEPLAFASYRYDTFHLQMPFYVCQKWEGIPEGIEGQNIAWVRYEDLAATPIPPGGIMVAHRLGEVLKEKGLR